MRTVIFFTLMLIARCINPSEYHSWVDSSNIMSIILICVAVLGDVTETFRKWDKES